MMYTYVLISEDDKEQEYAERFPEFIKFVSYKDDDGYDEQVCLAEFEDMIDFDLFQTEMLNRDNRIEIEVNDSEDMGFRKATLGCPIMVINDKRYVIDKAAWEDILRIYNGE